MIFQVPVEIIDFKEDRMALGLERAKVMLLVWVVGVAEIVETAMVLTMRATASWPSAAMPGVMTATPPARFCRSSSLSERMRIVFVSISILRCA